MDRIDSAFKAIKREWFVPEELKARSAVDTPLPIGFGQTISQPYTVRMMLEWLQVQPGDKILDVGSGSGWTSALLGYLTGPSGQVHAVEIVPALVAFGRANSRRTGLKNIRFHQAGRRYGLPRLAPYDRILVSATADEIPAELTNQLKPGGKLVIPVKNDIVEAQKQPGGKLETKTHPGFVFVPLIRG
ncbi:MAG TPA: protein-L-isoaspartate O-methyltransferase [Candidatus Saccharimonadales bacterium]|nr:protein-L-isoaspartate O-methyltransferase [Candidatus Saccharimonadales bacterium]